MSNFIKYSSKKYIFIADVFDKFFYRKKLLVKKDKENISQIYIIKKSN